MKNTTDKANAEVIDRYNQKITNGCIIRYQGENYTVYQIYDGLAINLWVSEKYVITLLNSLDMYLLELYYTPYFEEEIPTPKLN